MVAPDDDEQHQEGQEEEEEVQQQVLLLAGPQAAATLDQIANAVESTRPHEDDMFSPRSSAALTLTSIAMQAPIILPQPQALFTSTSSSPAALVEPPAEVSTTVAAAALSTTNSTGGGEEAENDDDDDDEDYFIDTKQAFMPPRETFAAKPNHGQKLSPPQSIVAATNNKCHHDTTEARAAAAANTKIRHVSVGSNANRHTADIENAPNFRNRDPTTAEQHPILRSSSRESFLSTTVPFSSSATSHLPRHQHRHSMGPSVLVSSYTLGPCAFSVTRSNPPPATAADFLPPSWDSTPRWPTASGLQRIGQQQQYHRNQQTVVPSAAYAASMANNDRWEFNPPRQLLRGTHQSQYGMVRTHFPFGNLFSSLYNVFVFPFLLQNQIRANPQYQYHNYYPAATAAQPKCNEPTTLFDPTSTVTPTPSKKVRLEMGASSKIKKAGRKQKEITLSADFQPSSSFSSNKTNHTYLSVSTDSNDNNIKVDRGSKLKKTLGSLAESFLERYEGMITKRKRGNNGDQAKERINIIIDDLAKDLEVERRRIYDVVNIFESLQIVVKRGKNTYEWMGREHLFRHFAIMQDEAVQLWPNHAVANGLVKERCVGDGAAESFPDRSAFTEAETAVENGLEDGRELNKSLTRLSQQFLQVFLVGFTTVNLPQASDIIQGSTSSQYDLAVMGSAGKPVPKDPKRFSQAAARGLKTKIRRLYDVANVYLAIGLLRRTEDRSAATVEGKRPHFHWNFEKGISELRDIFVQLPERMKTERNPFQSPLLDSVVAARKKVAMVSDAKVPTVGIEPPCLPPSYKTSSSSEWPADPDRSGHRVQLGYGSLLAPSTITSSSSQLGYGSIWDIDVYDASLPPTYSPGDEALFREDV
jgi:hypothetical protein